MDNVGVAVMLVLALYGASSYMLDYSLGYPKGERMTAEHWKNRTRNECPWTTAWMDSIYRNHCVKDTFLIMPSGYKAHASLSLCAKGNRQDGSCGARL